MRILIVPFFLLGCATVSPQQEAATKTLREKFGYDSQSGYDFQDSVAKGKLEAVKLFMNTFSPDTTTLEYALKQPAVLEFLLQQKATSPQAKVEVWDRAAEEDNFAYGDTGACIDPKTFNALIEFGNRPSDVAYMMKALVKHECVDSVKKYLTRFPDASATEEYSLQTKIENPKAKFDDLESSMLTDLSNALSDASKSECTKESVAACKANHAYQAWLPLINTAHDRWKSVQAEKIQQANAAEASKKERDEYEKSGQADFDKACRTLHQIEFDKDIIKEEKAIGAQTGVVNKVKLYEAGRRLQGDYLFLDSLKTSYKKRRGKSFDGRSCKTN
jgi:hypothetical protein